MGIIGVSKLQKQWAKGLGDLRGVSSESSDDDTPSSGMRRALREKAVTGT
jgi:hypothetical protein